MFRLTREVRFAVNAATDAAPPAKAANGHAGVPPLSGLGRHFSLRVTLRGELEPASQYLVNIKRIDDVVRERGIEAVAAAVHGQVSPPVLAATLFARLRDGWGAAAVEAVSLSLTPFLCVSAFASELPMVRLSQKFEFSAAHRLHNPSLTEEENRQVFGKCNNPHGHGHNYEVQVTLSGVPDGSGRLMDVSELERIVAATVIERFDHKHLNVETAEFRETIPSVENIARVIYRLLKPALRVGRTDLAAVTVWETPKTWCEYSE